MASMRELGETMQVLVTVLCALAHDCCTTAHSAYVWQYANGPQLQHLVKWTLTQARLGTLRSLEHD